MFLFSYMNTKIRPYFCHSFAVVCHPVYCTILSVRKFVLLCSHHLTVYLSIFAHIYCVSPRRCGACAAPSAEHARPQASISIEISSETNNSYQTKIKLILLLVCIFCGTDVKRGSKIIQCPCPIHITTTFIIRVTNSFLESNEA